jgi:hypothetical protein
MATRTPVKREGRIRCHGGVSILCLPVTPAMTLYFRFTKLPSSKPVRERITTHFQAATAVVPLAATVSNAFPPNAPPEEKPAYWHYLHIV